MVKFANAPQAAPAKAPYSIGAAPMRVATHESGVGFAPSNAHLELFNAAVSGLLADQFYESSDGRLNRLVELVPQCDPAWLGSFISWLRHVANLRSASVVLAAEYAVHDMPNARRVIGSALDRADEPAELLGYWMHRYGRAVPARVKKGVADAVTRLYTEDALLRHDGQSRAWRFGDVIEFVHPTPADEHQSLVFRHALDRRRHHRRPEGLARAALVHDLERVPTADRRSRLAEAVSVFSWERLAGWLPGGLDREAWVSMVPHLGYLALLRNLNNLDRAGVPAEPVVARLTDVEEIARSRVLPFRFLTAYLNLEADAYQVALSSAAEASVANLPVFPGRTLIMVDCSGSMRDTVGEGRSSKPLELFRVAAFMAEALARRCDEARIVCYDEEVRSEHAPRRHVGLLRAAADRRYQPDHGRTRTWWCTAEAYRGEDRVVTITDEQTIDADTGRVTCPVVTWNLAGYRPHHAAHGGPNRFLVAGYHDTALQVLPSIVAAGTGRWPWQ